MEPGEGIDWGIDWGDGAFVLDTTSGRVQAYRVKDEGGYREAYHDILSSVWVLAHLYQGSSWNHFLLNRETSDSWHWPQGAVRLVATADEHLLFLEHLQYEESGEVVIGHFALVAASGEVLTRFSIDLPNEEPLAFFSPDGQVLALEGAEAVYRMPVSASRPEILQPDRREGWQGRLAEPSYSGPKPMIGQAGWPYPHFGWPQHGPEPRVILATALYTRPNEGDPDGDVEHHAELQRFAWDGTPLGRVEPACAGRPSPDGRYVAQLQGGEVYRHYVGIMAADPPWPSVVIADASTCSPIFAVRSAYTFDNFWGAQWLSNSEGFVVGLADGYAVARVHPHPQLDMLPPTPLGAGRSVGPVPAPTGDGRYFAYDFVGVYDAEQHLWTLFGSGGWGPFSWGETHEEMWYEIGYWGEGRVEWLLLSPKIDLPPFGDEIAFRVAGTGSCLNLRSEGGTIDCLPDGARLVFVQPDEQPEAEGGKAGQYPYTPVEQPHPSVRYELGGGPDEPPGPWVHVRTEDGLEGWVAHDYLEHD